MEVKTVDQYRKTFSGSCGLNISLHTLKILYHIWMLVEGVFVKAHLGFPLSYYMFSFLQHCFYLQ